MVKYNYWRRKQRATNSNLSDEEKEILIPELDKKNKGKHHIRNGLIEIGSGLAVWILGGIAVYNTMQKDPESTSNVGYGAVMIGSTLIANGVVRATGNSQTTLKEDYISLVKTPLAEAVKQYNDTENPNGKNRSAGRTIDFSNKEE